MSDAPIERVFMTKRGVWEMSLTEETIERSRQVQAESRRLIEESRAIRAGIREVVEAKLSGLANGEDWLLWVPAQRWRRAP